MKLSEILDQVDTLVPNALAVSLKVAWINQVQNQLYRDYDLPDQVSSLAVTAGRANYDLPANCAEDRILRIDVNGEKLPFSTMFNADDDSTYWTIIDRQLVINPKPKKDVAGRIVYRPRPTPLSETDLDMEPSFPSDYQELLVLGCAVRAAKVTPDMQNMIQLLETEFNQLAAVAKMALRRKGQRAVKVSRPFM